MPQSVKLDDGYYTHNEAAMQLVWQGQKVNKYIQTAVKRRRTTRFKRRNISVDKTKIHNQEYYVNGMNMFDEEQEQFSDYHQIPNSNSSPYRNDTANSKGRNKRVRKGKQSKMSM